MAREYPDLKRAGIEVMVLAPDRADALASYWHQHALPFRVASDPGGKTLRALGQEVRWSRLGRMPALVAVQKGGQIMATHYGTSMQDVGDTASFVARLTAGAQGKEGPG